MCANSEKAEKALQRKYALLRRKQAEAASKRIRPVSGQKEDAKLDPVRQAAVAALKAKKAARTKGSSAPTANTATMGTAATTSAKPTSATVEKSASGSLNLKFVIPKRTPEATNQPPASQTCPLAPAAPADVATGKRPTLKRPAARLRPESTSTRPRTSLQDASISLATREQPNDASRRAHFLAAQVDAFASRASEGNPAAACLLSHPLLDELMQKIAEENNLSETTFIEPSPSATVNRNKKGRPFLSTATHNSLCCNLRLFAVQECRLNMKVAAVRDAQAGTQKR